MLCYGSSLKTEVVRETVRDGMAHPSASPGLLRAESDSLPPAERKHIYAEWVEMSKS